MPQVQLLAPVPPALAPVLSPEALDFVVDLEQRFGPRRRELLAARAARPARLDAGESLDFLPETAAVRSGEGKIALGAAGHPRPSRPKPAEPRAVAGGVPPPPADLQDRRVEITGPVDRKMVINALNSGARCFMADFEDAHGPTWSATLEGQQNLSAAIRRTLTFRSPEGKDYKLNDQLATLIVRPRGWALPEKHVEVDGQPMSGALFDFGLYLFHNAQELLARGSGPYFYIPKLEGHLEARLWNDVFSYTEERLGLPHGSIRCTVLIETITAAFEMDEILHELRDYICGLNCGRWDYIFSFIKRFSAHPERCLPERGQVTMLVHFLRSYSRLLIKTCHRRGAHAMGGMAAQIPIKDDPAANEIAFAKVRADKEREAGDGHDGTWVAHPGLVTVALEVFNQHMPGPNQLDRTLDDLTITAADLLQLPVGTITEAGLRNNVSAGLRYMAAWLAGRGAVPIHNLMEDAATAEIARAQLWQWVRYPGGVLDDGRKITPELFQQTLAEELELAREELGEAGDPAASRLGRAAELLRQIVLQDRFEEFLTLPAYAILDETAGL